MWIALFLFACRETPTEPAVGGPIEAYDAVDYVDPFIGTDGLGAQVASVTPGASMPFGMTLVGPDTGASYGAPDFYHCAGYHWPDDRIYGFSHVHSHGMGVTDYGTIQVMPQDGWTDEASNRSVRAMFFDHADETAAPGFYSVDMQGGAEGGGISVAIAATERGAAHTYGFSAGADPVLAFDLAFSLGSDTVSEGRATADLTSGTLSGFQRLHGAYSGRFGGLQTHFAARFDPAPIGGGSWADGGTSSDLSVDGESVGLWLRFPPGRPRSGCIWRSRTSTMRVR